MKLKIISFQVSLSNLVLSVELTQKDQHKKETI